MKRHIVYLNGKFVPLTQAKISVLDRGFLFGDGVYEVIPIYQGKLFGLKEHYQRLRRSLHAIHCSFNLSYRQLEKNILRLLLLNQVKQGDYALYLQVTRGVDSGRNRCLPRDLKPTVLILAQALSPLNYKQLQAGKAAITAPDIRWQYCHIKSISLLPTLLLVDQARKVGCEETILIRDGKVLEGTSSNIFVVKNNRIFTPRLSQNNLSGVTRDLILKLARQNKITIIEKNITPRFLKLADEIWISSSTRGIYPIIKLNGKKVGNGRAGKMWERMIRIYLIFRNFNVGTK